jgi:hypothetical protein
MGSIPKEDALWRLFYPSALGKKGNQGLTEPIRFDLLARNFAHW